MVIDIQLKEKMDNVKKRVFDFIDGKSPLEIYIHFSYTKEQPINEMQS